MLCASAAALQASFGGLGMAALSTTPRLLAVAGPLTSASAMHYGLFNARAYATVDADTKAPGADPRGPQLHEQLHAPPKSVQLDSPSFASGAVAPHPGIKASFAASGAAAPHVASPLAATPSPLAAAAPSPDDAVPESHMPHPAYSPGYLETVRPSHVAPEKVYQHVGFTAIRIMRAAFDKATGYSSVPGAMTEAAWLRRIVFLETVAGVPGMVAGMQRHLRSLRSMQRDMGWIHTLLEEAENERMHLLTFLQLRQPGPLFRAAVIAAQGVFFNAYFLAYLLSPRTCHAFVGFLEEEAVKTYTHALAEIDAGRLWKDRPAPPMAVQYWGLPPGANMRDLVLAVRADEACHAHVNHTLSRLQPAQVNPFANGASQLP